MSAPTAQATWQQTLQTAHTHAQSNRFDDCLAASRRILNEHSDNPEALLSVGSLLLNFGFLSEARHCFLRTCTIAPTDPRPVANLANTLQAAALIDEAIAAYRKVLPLARPPLSHRIASNYLIALQYHPDYSAGQLRQAAAEIGRQFDAAQPMAARPLEGRPLRVGFVSADLCDHPVGLFLLPLLRELDHTRHARITPLLYANGGRNDLTAQALKRVAQWHDVADLGHDALVQRIRADRIDILIDLSGHTAGNRLPVFAQRAAPLQLSWLGYFATTGVPAMDYVVMDPWHAPAGFESQFTERLVRLPHSRFCYEPVSFAPEVSPPPCHARGYVTFGSFNNTTKLNDRVLTLWAGILQRVPRSRLVLKWRTFADESLCQSVRDSFTRRGIAPDRIELRRASFHADVLKEYADIDIALDPFPFTGGYTSCEALWMGVPVITLPGSRPVSRQTLCFLENIGLSEFAARDETDYANKAAALANDTDRMSLLRSSMRERMRDSPLMDAKAYATAFTGLVEALARDGVRAADPIATSSNTIGANRESVSQRREVLHVGCGSYAPEKLHAAFRNDAWREVRLDIDPNVKPDIVASITAMAPVADGSFDAVFSSHNLEHLYAHEVPAALQEFRRVLRPAGFALVTLPDLQEVARLVAEGKLAEPAYVSPAGPIAPLDILYGFRPALAQGNLFMAHRTGFTAKTLAEALLQAGFAVVSVQRNPAAFSLWAIAFVARPTDEQLKAAQAQMFPAPVQ